MKVEIVVDPSRIPPAPLSTRVAPANKQNAPARFDSLLLYTYLHHLILLCRTPPSLESYHTIVTPHPEISNDQSAGANGQTTAPGNRRGGARGRGKTGNNKAPQKSAAELDAEMEDYQKANE
ncbi:hypothetical protein PSTG_04315 [Puccinia striiformis f. sp. tritici PST-78]|uniref:Chromatin target of PRMT1 protein C-terminal domain-containing protein n=1 Tax=Puccinia striiformis f. sp. tritici PST-78 TaxID=1165861 RepID=A0A0L0VT01_9BASI|nr:hypothetical protein PSTG_04315 [Puccinia striiformis f. sp. tritici PST-78]